MSINKGVRNLLKVALWIIGCITGFLLLIILLIQLDSVQNFLRKKATTYISDRTHTRVEIGHIRISFPKEIVLENVFLDDLNKDTLFSAGLIGINVEMFALLSHKLIIDKIRLKNLHGIILREENDSLFNYAFLLKAFVSDSVVKVVDTTSKPMEIKINQLSTQNINFSFIDKLNGSSLKANIGKLDLTFEKFDIPENIYHAKNLELADISFQMNEDKNTPATDTGKSVLPDIQVKQLSLKNINVAISNTLTGENLKLVLGKCDLQTKNLSLIDSKADITSLNITNTLFSMVSGKLETITQKEKSKPWTITAGDLELNNINFQIQNMAQKHTEGFDPNHINISDLNLRVSNLSFLQDKFSADVKTLSLNEQSGLKLTNFKSKISFDDTHATLDELELVTQHTTLRDYLTISYKSLNDVSKNPGEMGISARLKNSQISTADILLFQPALKKQSLFASASRIIYIDTRINGKLKDLEIPQLIISTDRTKLNASIKIKGLPNIKNTHYIINIASLSTGRDDILKLVPAKLPADKIPSSVFLSAKFKGSLNNFNSYINMKSPLGNIIAEIKMKPGEDNFQATIKADEINLRKLLKDTMFEKVSLTAVINGTSFDYTKAIADLNVTIHEVDIKKYKYADIIIKGKLASQLFDGNISMNDSNLAFDFGGKVLLKKSEEQFAFNFNLKGVNLKNLNLTDKDIRISAHAEADLHGNSMNTFNGKAGITNLIIIKEGKLYTIDSLLFVSLNEKAKSSFSFNSSIVNSKFEGQFVPGDLGNVIIQQVNRYFDIGDKISQPLQEQNFSFEIKLKNHPLLREVLLPGLEEFEFVDLNGSLDSRNNILKLNATVPRLNYNGIKIEGLAFKLESDATKINYSLNLSEVSNPSIKLINTTLSGNIKNNVAEINLAMKDSASKDKLSLISRITSMHDGDYSFTILPGGLSLNGSEWSVPDDNFAHFGKFGLLFNHFEITNQEQLLSIHTPAQTVGKEIDFEFRKFKLETVSQLIEKDSSLIGGLLTGKFQTRNTQAGTAFVADLNIASLSYHTIPVGNLSLKADNSAADNYNAKLILSGYDNNIDVTAQYLATIKPEIKVNAEIKSLSMKSVSAFSNGTLKNANGTINGKIQINGSVSAPEIEGALNFNNAAFHSAFANNYFTLKNEKLNFSSDGLNLSQFTITDSTGHTAILNGKISLEKFKISTFNLDAKLDQFTALNTTEKDNKLFYSKLILNSTTRITGNLNLPKVYSKTKLVEESSFTVVVPASKVSSDRGEGVVAFTDEKNKINPILTREVISEKTKSEITGIDLYADLEVDRNSTLKIIVDPVSGDSLVLKGDATLSFAIDPSGKTSLTGTYTVAEGSYRVSLQDLIRKDFKITPGSTIIWNGDPMDADIKIDAVHERKTSPLDLVAGQIGGLSEQEKNTYKQKLPFQIILHLKGALLKPTISFEIDLPPKYRGAMGGTVYSKLNLLNADPSELNKQVFALLVLGRFVQEDPLASSGGGGGINSVARTSVSKFLSQQLNRFSDKFVKGVELNFDLQSYDDYSSGTSEARTQLAVGIKKQLFNERVSVEVGSMVDLSNKNNQTNANELASDVTVEYKLTDDGIYRLKAFRQNQYQDVIEGPLNVTGMGLIYNRDFDKWQDLFRHTESKDEINVPLKYPD